MTIINPIYLIEKKRDGYAHTKKEIDYLVDAVLNNEIKEYQLSAWLMAAYINGLNDNETLLLTKGLANSGETIKYPSDIKIIDKHSTGGVGDKTSIILVPLVAACGASISKLSGPALGYTGGTIDKLRAIKNINLNLSKKELQKQVHEIGCAISGHSTKLAPAEEIFYKMRDVTATVASIPLISSSIISKKLAGGAYGYVFDVKYGSGAFMEDIASASLLAQNLVSLTKKINKTSMAVITNMEQPLGEFVGNAAEIYEAIEVLKGKGPTDTRELCVVLGANMLLMAGISKTIEDASSLCNKALQDGSALKKFKNLVNAQDGDISIFSKPELLYTSVKKVYNIKANKTGYISKLDARLIGEALRALGGGRYKEDDIIDTNVSIRLLAKLGEEIKQDQIIIKIYYNSDIQLKKALVFLNNSWSISNIKKNIKLIEAYYS